MKVIALILLGVLLIDAVAYAVFFDSLSAGGVALAFLATFFVALRGWFRRPVAEVVAGWSLGPALELTDPHRPTRTSNAILSTKVLKLGFLALGSPGSGKTESVALGYLHSLKAQGIGWAFFEGKGDTDIYKKACAMGSPPDHFFSSELPGSESINLMAGEPHDVIDRLGKILIGTTASTSYYSDEQRAVLTRLIPVLMGINVPVNLRDLYVCLCVYEAGRELVRRGKEAGIDPVTLSLADQWLSIPAGKRIQTIAGLLNRLFVFVSGPYADRLNCYQPDIDIARIIPSGQSLYLHLPLTTFSRDVAIAIVESFGVEARKRQLSGTEDLSLYPLIFDDWGAFFHDGFGPFSARCRSAAMPLSFGFQSRAQLEYVSPVYADELDDTITTKIVLRVQGNATGEYASELLGMFESREVSTSDYGARDATTLSMKGRPRIEARELRELQDGEAFVSTLQHVRGRVTNPLWKLRFPLPPFDRWQSVSMPAPRLHDEGEGLGFWRRYMDPRALAELHAQILDTLHEEQGHRENDRTVRTRDERAKLAENPGVPLEILGVE